MKSYTNINQSKKLAEILPIESADMFWLVVGNTPRVHVLTEPLSNYSRWENYPCWSLSALLEQLDDNITNDEGNDLLLEVHKEDGLYYLNYHDRWEWQDDIETDYYDDLVDACVEMIEKLHEQKLL